MHDLPRIISYSTYLWRNSISKISCGGPILHHAPQPDLTHRELGIGLFFFEPLTMIFCPTWLFYNKQLFFSVTPNQIERLYSRFTSLDKNDCGTLAREDFLRIPELAINPLSERIVHSFFAASHDDRVNFLQFMRVLAHFRPIRKTRENKLNSRDDKLRCMLISVVPTIIMQVQTNKQEKEITVYNPGTIDKTTPIF